MDDRYERDTRPSPEALLQQCAQESRGRLKIFLGAAPGVGKTYAMLEEAQAKRREGVDLVVGVAETHGRKETEALLQDLEIISRRLFAATTRATVAAALKEQAKVNRSPGRF